MCSIPTQNPISTGVHTGRTLTQWDQIGSKKLPIGQTSLLGNTHIAPQAGTRNCSGITKLNSSTLPNISHNFSASYPITFVVLTSHSCYFYRRSQLHSGAKVPVLHSQDVGVCLRRCHQLGSVVAWTFLIRPEHWNVSHFMNMLVTAKASVA